MVPLSIKPINDVTEVTRTVVVIRPLYENLFIMDSTELFITTTVDMIVSNEFYVNHVITVHADCYRNESADRSAETQIVNLIDFR
jgi:hypothetical protein